jgi:hypothetical protein
MGAELVRVIKGLKSETLIRKMIELNLLTPMNDKMISHLKYSFNPEIKPFNALREIEIKIPTTNYYKQTHKVNQTKHFFGYEPDSNEIDLRLNELQNVIDSFELKHSINVRLYYKFSELMQRLMYEYGCFDGVYESAGDVNNKIRNSIKFPQIRTFNDKKLYLKEKLYYIDLNGAYMSVINGIPSGLPSDGFVNYKINDLIKRLYSIRQKAKNNGNHKLATTIKFMMNSCVGYSMKRPKVIKHKYAKDVNKYMDTFAPFVAGYNLINNSEGFVDTVNSFVPSFNHVQFAKKVMDEYDSLMSKIKSLVHVYYENIDAILINESDYNKLESLGFIGNDLGQFKIEHIFTEIAILSKKRYMGKLINGSVFRHCVNDYVNYEDFINEVLY